MSYFTTKRGDAGIGERYKEAVSGLPEGAPITDTVLTVVADWAIDRYEVRVRAKLRAAGLEIPEDGPIDSKVIISKIKSALDGLEVDSLTPEGLMLAIDKKLAAELSARLGFTVTTALNAEEVWAQVKAQVLLSLADGSGAALIKGATLRALRSRATFQRRGFDKDMEILLRNRKYQKKYRRTHKQQWD